MNPFHQIPPPLSRLIKSLKKIKINETITYEPLFSPSNQYVLKLLPQSVFFPSNNLELINYFTFYNRSRKFLEHMTCKRKNTIEKYAGKLKTTSENNKNKRNALCKILAPNYVLHTEYTKKNNVFALSRKLLSRNDFFPSNFPSVSLDFKVSSLWKNALCARLTSWKFAG